jgi:hypothetical protein
MLEGDSAQRSEIGYPRLSVPVFETESTKSLALLTRQPAPVAYLTVKGARAEGSIRLSPLTRSPRIHEPKCVDRMKSH